MHPIEFTWYKIIVLIASLAAVGFGIVNIIYWNQIRDKDDCADISSGLATTLLWLNVVLVILAGVVLLWSLFRLLFDEDRKEEVRKHYITSYEQRGMPVSGTVPGAEFAQRTQTVTTSPRGTTAYTTSRVVQ